MTRKALAVFALTLLIACGGNETATTTQDSAPSTSAAATDSTVAPQAQEAPAAGLGTGQCALITLAEASVVMKHEMKFAPASTSECGLRSASDDPSKSISFQVQPGTGTYDLMATAAGTQVLQGVGDKAVLANNMVAAVKGGRTYLGGVFDSADTASMGDKSIELAKKVVARM